MAELRVLGVHGLGDHRGKPWKEEWEAAVRAALGPRPGLGLAFDFLEYDAIFAKVDLSAWEVTKAVGKLVGSGISSLFRGAPRGARGGAARGIASSLRWTAGYVVAWVEDREFQKKTRAAFLDKVGGFRPDVILAHSLGSLVGYNALTHRDAKAGKLPEVLGRAAFVSLGSQIGNAFVVGNLTHGRVQPLPVEWWYHLYNHEDDVFTAPIRLWDAPNFTQVDTPFDVEGFADHDALEYLKHGAAVGEVWEALAWRATAGKARGAPLFARASLPEQAPARKTRAKPKPRRRALLVGINDYPNAADRLEGCVNDVFLMSALLQECGFEAEDIRVCLDRRATARGILERLEWLLDDPRPGDQLVFYYSGHGAQLPSYGAGDTVDRKDETLVPWDFDWSLERCVTDDQLYALYSQLPYGTQLVALFDCCHSGGIHRAGAPRARGLNPPDDIRHRDLRWDAKAEMWTERSLALTERSADFSDDEEARTAYYGEGGATTRLGRGSRVRALAAADYDAAKKAAGGAPVGPYLPVIIEACAEQQLAYEYRHGAISHGAFTYSLGTILRRERVLTFRQLEVKVAAQLRALEYEQEPQILGPRKVLDARVPFLGAARRKAKR
ncbi:MAG TPA: caspase family protein [Planctomycetota bacterium]